MSDLNLALSDRYIGRTPTEPIKINFRGVLGDGPAFNAFVYKTILDGREIYGIAIGKEGTEIPSYIGRVVDPHVEDSGFINYREMEAWLSAKVEELSRAGHDVGIKGNGSFELYRAVRELASESGD